VAPAGAPTSRATTQVADTVAALPARIVTRCAHSCWRTSRAFFRPPVEPFIAQIHPRKFVRNPLLAVALDQGVTQITRVDAFFILFTSTY
jgi:hypothetical protein